MSLDDLFISPGDTILQALAAINRGRKQIGVVVDEDRRLLGTVTDGDIRRAILSAIPLSDPVARIMAKNPLSAAAEEGEWALLERMRARLLHALPLVDSQGRVVDVVTADELMRSTRRDNWVVLMAGGFGMRLRPLTDDRPKPMLEVGGKPLLETMLERLVAQEFSRFFISVHYRAEMIREHFGDGRKWGVRIDYLHEAEPRGTAGCLSMLPGVPDKPVLVMNGDLLTDVNFAGLLRYHQEQGVTATMGVVQYDFQVPYGVVQLNHSHITGIDEKPTHSFFVNAGVYVLEPEVVAAIPGQGCMDITTLFQGLMAEGRPTAAFPIQEYWLDIGSKQDFHAARARLAGDG